MAAILTAEDVVRRIAAECTYVDERGGVGIRPFSGGLPRSEPPRKWTVTGMIEIPVAKGSGC